MERTYCTKDYNKLSEKFFNQLSSESSKYDIDKAIKELGIFVKGYQKNEKHHNYWVNFKLLKIQRMFRKSMLMRYILHPLRILRIRFMLKE